ncbi:MAG: class II aldolase/adducin family protein, partial [Salinisphaera sp.]|nr:class II aldolase/adducin family protein [Salinisphaera sp.]
MKGSRSAPDTSSPRNRDAVGGDLAAAARACAGNSACLAISGNFSARVDASSILITAAGIDKAACTANNLVLVNLGGEPLGVAAPSSDTELHLAIYALEPATGAVMHEHSVASTVVSRLGGKELIFEGYELAKAFAGITSHRARLALPI